MYIQELYKLTLWITEEVTGKQLPQKYQQLFQKLSENIQPNRQKQPFDIQRNNLIDALKEMKLEVLNEEQKDFLDNLNILNISIEELNNQLLITNKYEEFWLSLKKHTNKTQEEEQVNSAKISNF